MAAKVADASVLDAIVFDEPRSQQALALLRGQDIYGPTLLPYELNSIARKKARLYPDQSEAITRRLHDVLSLEMDMLDVDHRSVLELALYIGLTTYDASYIRLAEVLGVGLVTFDRAQQQGAIQWLGADRVNQLPLADLED